MNHDTETILKKLFAIQNFAVLATSAGNQPYTNIVAFHSSEDLRYIAFFTPRNTAKHERILNNPGISLFIDNRSNRESDVTEAVGVTMIGTAVDMDSAAEDNLRREFIKKHPGLKDFAGSPESAMITARVKRYHIVSRFQNVIVVDMDNS